MIRRPPRSTQSRSSAASDVYKRQVFGLPLFPDVRLTEVLAALPGAAVYGLAAHEGAPLAAAGLRRPAVLAVGAERPGLSGEVLAHVTQLVTIPLAPGLSLIH